MAPVPRHALALLVRGLAAIGLRHHERLSDRTADTIYDAITDALPRPEFRPRALYQRFNIEAISTTDAATDSLAWHDSIRASGWKGRVLPAYRPDAVIDPDRTGFAERVAELCDLAGTPVSWEGYLEAHRIRRQYFIARGATSTDHGHPSAMTADLPTSEAAALFERLLAGSPAAGEAETFRGQMLTEMARMSLEDGLVMQLHPGSFRNHSPVLFAAYGADKGADIPTPTNYVRRSSRCSTRSAADPRLTLILFTLDETAYSRELAPLAGVYPALRLGPPWWFYDSFEGMRRFRERFIETAGFYNTVGFNDDTRAYLSIPARHDMSRRADCGYLARSSPITGSTSTRRTNWPMRWRMDWRSGRTNSDPYLATFTRSAHPAPSPDRAREHLRRHGRLAHPEVVAQHALEDRAHIGRRRQSRCW